MIEKYLTVNRKILFFVDSFKGGAGNVVQILAKSFSSRGCDVTVCCVGGTTVGRHDLEGVNVIGIKSKLPGCAKYFEYIAEIRKVIAKERADCVISFLFGISAFVGVGIKKHRDYIFITSERSNPYSLKPHGIIKKMVRKAYNKADAIVVLFDAFKFLEDSLFVDKCITIPNPVPIIKNENVEKKDDCIRFITVANERHEKGLDLLIKAFSKLIEHKVNAILYIYGDIKTDMLPNMIKEYSLTNSVILAGYTHDVNSALLDSDIYILSSRQEGFPNSLCEAMAAGKACISFECHKGINELIQNGVNGVVVPAEDYIALSNEMIRLATNFELIVDYGNNARKISELYCVNAVTDIWDKMMMKIENSYRRNRSKES